MIHLISRFIYLFRQVPVEIPLVITNTGKTIVYWHFLTKLDEFGISKSWIKVSLKSGLLLPNEVCFLPCIEYTFIMSLLY